LSLQTADRCPKKVHKIQYQLVEVGTEFRECNILASKTV
jgi:hypothetical protein